MYRDRVCVSSVCAIAEEDSQMCEMWKSEGGVLSNELCDGYNERQLQNVLSSVSQCFGNTPGLCTMGKCKVEVVEGSEVVNMPPHQVPMQLKGAVDSEIERLLQAGIVTQSTSEWSSPIVPVKKKDGNVRLCVDFWELNRITQIAFR